VYVLVHIQGVFVGVSGGMYMAHAPMVAPQAMMQPNTQAMMQPNTAMLPNAGPMVRSQPCNSQVTTVLFISTSSAI